MTDEHFQILQSALALDGSRVSVRAPGAIAELIGPLEVRRPLPSPSPNGASADEWLTLGGESGSHVHLRSSSIAALRFSAPPDGNAAIEALSPDGARLCRISFARTNRARPEHDAARLDEVRRRFGHLAPPEARDG